MSEKELPAATNEKNIKQGKPPLEIRTWIKKTFPTAELYQNYNLDFSTAIPIKVYLISLAQQKPGIITVVYGGVSNPNTKKINLTLEDINYFHLLGSGNYIIFLFNPGEKSSTPTEFSEFDKIGSRIFSLINKDNFKMINHILLTAHEKKLELSKKMEELLLKEDEKAAGAAKAGNSKKKSSPSSPSSFEDLAKQIKTESYEDFKDTDELSYDDSDIPFMKAFVGGPAASGAAGSAPAASGAAGSAPAASAPAASAAAASAAAAPALSIDHSSVFNSYELNQLDMDEAIEDFNITNGTNVTYKLLYNREYKKPAFLIMNQGGGYMHLNIGPYGIHFTLERIRSLNSEKYHIFLDFKSEGKKPEAGASSKSTTTSNIQITDAKGVIIDANYISKQFNESLLSKSGADAAASAGAGARPVREFKFIPNSVLLLSFLNHLIINKVLDLKVEMKGGNYYEKYMKYKTKYLQLKKLLQ